MNGKYEISSKYKKRIDEIVDKANQTGNGAILSQLDRFKELMQGSDEKFIGKSRVKMNSKFY